MDINFSCHSCKQELIVDAAGAGNEIQCPSCGTVLTIPAADPANIHLRVPEASREEGPHFSVPQHEGPVKPLIQSALPPMEATRDGERRLRIRTIRRSECVEVGKDLFDQKVSEFLQDVGEKHIVKIDTISYTHQDLASKAMLTDYGVLVIYKG